MLATLALTAFAQTITNEAQLRTALLVRCMQTNATPLVLDDLQIDLAAGSIVYPPDEQACLPTPRRWCCGRRRAAPRSAPNPARRRARSSS